MLRSFWKQYKKRILIISTILFFFLLLFLQTETNKIGSNITGVIQTVGEPIQSTYRSIVDSTSNIWKRYVWLIKVEQDNEKLKKHISDLNEQVLVLKEKSIAYERFQKLLNFSVPQTKRKIFAKIIGQIHRRHSDLFIVNRGSRDGVHKNYAVVSSNGVIGKIYEAGLFQSQILVISDPSFVISAALQRTRTRMLVKGSYSTNLESDQFPYEVDVHVGDTVISTGLAGIFPAGLLIGKVTKFQKKSFGLFQRLEIKPSAPLSKQEEVIIILEKKTKYQPLFTFDSKK